MTNNILNINVVTMSTDETELDILYSPSKWSKRLPGDIILEKHVELIGNYSENVRKEIKCDLNLAYGTGEREVIDIYGTDLADDAPIFIHIHGGYWQEPSMTHANNSFIAKNLYENNIKSIFIGYELCPKVTVPQISRNIEKAILKCLEYANQHKPRGIYLSGHSVGAQLVAALFESFVPSLPKEDQKLIKAAFLLCGCYDLLPLLQTQYNILPRLDENSAKTASPLFMKLSAGEGTTFYVVVAEHDSPPFVEWGEIFNNHLSNLSIATKYVFIKNVDHFDIIEKLIEEDFELTRLIIDAIKGK